ncbi:MAG: ABC transporter permease [Clostridia bacterium]|nr:ABC transporter permease [Clostridia bacterium]
MRNNIITIMKKELKRVFLDRKLAFAVFIMPGLTIAVIYSLMGGMVDKLGKDTVQYVPVVHTINAPDEFLQAAQEMYGPGITVVMGMPAESEELKAKVMEGDADMLLVFEDDFMNRTSGGLPSVDSYMNSTRDYSVRAEYMITGVLDSLKMGILAQRLGGMEGAAVFETNKKDLADSGEKAGKAIGMLLPMLLTIFLFAGAMQVGMDTIAGEKERGTIATMLMTPVKRGHIAMGKMLSLAIISLVSCLSSIAGIIISLPFSNTIFGGGFELSDLAYKASDFALMILQTAAMALSFVSMICLISSLARNIKEAGGFIAPAYMVVMVMSMSTMFMRPEAGWSYFIPVYGNILCIKDILIFDYAPLHGIYSLLSTLAFSGLMAWLMVRAFYSERIMKSA